MRPFDRKSNGKLRTPGVFQRLVEMPLLHEGRSHSFRVFVLITSTAPLRFWIWPDAYAMVGPVPYQYLNATNPSGSLPSVCAMIINAFFQKRHCWALKKADESTVKMKFMRLKSFFEQSTKLLSKRGHRASAQTLYDRTKDAVRMLILAGYGSFVGGKGHQFLGIDMILDDEGVPHVLEINRSPGTTEDDAGRKKLIHDSWISMTGSFAHDFKAQRWDRCQMQGDPGARACVRGAVGPWVRVRSRALAQARVCFSAEQELVEVCATSSNMRPTHSFRPALPRSMPRPEFDTQIC